jgi:hypothetical protein
MTAFCRNFNNNCKFLILENDYSLFKNEQRCNIITKWRDKKHFLEDYALLGIVLVAIVDFINVDFINESKIILDEELYNEFEIEIGFTPNTFYREILNNSSSKIFNTLYIFTYQDNRIFDYSNFNLYNGCDISIICNILISLDHEVFDLGSLRSCYLTGSNERYNNCVICEFKLHFTKDD